MTKKSLGLVITLALAILFIGYAVLQAPKTHLGHLQNKRFAQTTDVPLGYSVGEGSEKRLPPFDHRFIRLRSVDLFKIPTTTGLAYPLGARDGTFSYNAQPYWSENKKRGGRHTGDDWNGIGGMNSDLGDPVYAVGDGMVVYAGEPSPSWGKVIIIAHRMPDGKYLQSMYAHLEEMKVHVFQIVERREVVGTVGTAGGKYLAHLHFEMRDSKLAELGPGYTFFPSTRLDPTEIIQKYFTDRPSLLHAARSKRVGTLQMNGESAQKWIEYMGKE